MGLLIAVAFTVRSNAGSSAGRVALIRPGVSRVASRCLAAGGSTSSVRVAAARR